MRFGKKKKVNGLQPSLWCTVGGTITCACANYFFHITGSEANNTNFFVFLRLELAILLLLERNLAERTVSRYIRNTMLSFHLLFVKQKILVSLC